MRILIVSAYELGHQPLLAATAAAVLRRGGHEVRVLDLSLGASTDTGGACLADGNAVDGSEWESAVSWAEAAAFAVPMHTAARLVAEAAAEVRRRRPSLPMVAFGLYAGVLGADPVAGELFGWTIAGEYEAALAEWGGAIASGGGAGDSLHRLSVTSRAPTSPPARDLLAPLASYARLAVGDDRRLAGYVEASRGCSHHCTHCPIPPVYGGRLRIVDADSVVADVDRLVEAGAAHITFGDPDFLNGPRHALRVVDEVHRRHPGLTFDVTAKVEHILRHENVWSHLAGAGLLFVVTAVECVDDAILRRLAKNHTAVDAARAVDILRCHGIEARPSFLPFTPWTTRQGVLDIVDFVVDHDLVPNVEPVQYSIRLLVPPGSALLADDPAAFGPYDPARLCHPWSAPDPVLDELQLELAAIAAGGVGEEPEDVFPLVYEAVADAVGGPPRRPPTVVRGHSRPRLTEPWFCCAEPTEAQRRPARQG